MPSELRFSVVIPARYASARLPGKPLLELAGKPMILHVVENARQSGAEHVIVATDDERIRRVVADAGFEAELTSAACASGTDRIAEVARARTFEAAHVVGNVQGDEPLLEPELVRTVAVALDSHRAAGVATIATPIRTRDDLFDANVVKVTVDETGLALYFSRAPIPWVRDAFPLADATPLPDGVPFLRHVGLYAYRVSTLLELADAASAAIERAEKLEQLRALRLGHRIHVSVVDEPPGHGVDTPKDVERVERFLRARKQP